MHHQEIEVKHLGCAVVATLMLVACVHPGIPPEIAAKPQQNRECLRVKMMKPEYASLQGKYFFNGSEPPLSALANNTYPTNEEKEEINRWSADRMECRALLGQYVAYFGRRDPTYNSTFAKAIADGDEILLML